MLRVILVAMCLVAVVMACGPSAMPEDSESSTNPEQPEESGPALLLDEESAISILQAFLQECLLSWPKQVPQSEQQKKSWLMDLASRTTGDFSWSASHHGVSEVPNRYTRAGTAIEAETWVVIGPGLEGAENQSVVPGRWKVYAGYQRAYYLDAPARLALEEYNKKLTRNPTSCYR